MMTRLDGLFADPDRTRALGTAALQVLLSEAHSFTHPWASSAGLPGIAYDEVAARRSWQAMLDFFVGVL